MPYFCSQWNSYFSSISSSESEKLYEITQGGSSQPCPLCYITLEIITVDFRSLRSLYCVEGTRKS